MTGRLSVVFGIGYVTPAALSAPAGGWLVAHVSVRGTFLVAAAVTLVIALQVFWRLDAAREFEGSFGGGEDGIGRCGA